MLCGMKETHTAEDTGATSSRQFCLENHAQGSSHSTGRCGRHQNFISLQKRILVMLVLKSWMKERNNAVLRKDAF